MRFFMIALMLFAFSANAEISTIVIKDGIISPTEIIMPANNKITLKIQNLDANFEEFKSEELNLIIKAMPLNSDFVVSMPALAPGVYPFSVEFKGSLLKLKEAKEIHGNIVVK